jgi:hypothetical protein
MSLGRSVTVITPTTGAPELVDALISVENQDYDGPIDHLVVVDGQEFLPKVIEMVERSGTNPTVMVLPYNTGANGWNGHRVYSAVPALVNSEYIAFLDQDNWYEVNHISSLAAKLDNNENLELAFSLRSIYEKDRTYVTDDNCESLGLWPIWNSGGTGFLIDTSCFFFRTAFIRRTGRKWLHPYNADAVYSMSLKTAFSGKYETTGLYTLGYRLGGGPKSVKKEFFLIGNIYYMDMYPGGNYPWKNFTGK